MTIAFKQLVIRTLPERIVTILKKIHYLRTLKSVSDSNEVEFEVIKHLVKPGDNVADIGANIGVYTKFLSGLVGTQGHVYSIEPIPATFGLLCFNVRKLQLENVELIECAISDMNGTVPMEIPIEEYGYRNFYQARIVDEVGDNLSAGIIVQSRTIDSLFSGSRNRISFVKCDVEGHELNCVKGGRNLIRDMQPAWLMEISGNPDELGTKAYQTVELLYEQGYEAFWYDGNEIRKRQGGEISVNYFFLTAGHLEGLKGRGLGI